MKRTFFLALFGLMVSVVVNASSDLLFLHDIQNQRFSGGTEKLTKYIEKTAVYPIDALNSGQQGRVTVQFIVKRNGSIADAKIVESASIENKELRDLLDAEALRIVNNMPRWKPARDNKGKRFGLGAELIIDFRLQKNEVPVTIVDKSGFGCRYHVTIWQEPRKMGIYSDDLL